MKKLLLITISLFLSVNVFAENKSNPHEIPKFEYSSAYKELIKKYMPTIINPKKKPVVRSTTAGRLVNDYSMLRNRKIKKDEKVLNHLTTELIKLYKKLEKDNSDNISLKSLKLHVIDFVARFSNSPQSHKFILKILKNGPEELRRRALGGISVLGVHGEDIWDAVMDLEKRGIYKRKRLLMTLKAINLEKGKTYLLDIAKSTDDPEEFYRAGNLLSYYDDPELLHDILPLILKWEKVEFSRGVTPVDTIASRYLIKYIKQHEGDQFKIALDVIIKKGSRFDPEFVAILKYKLASNNQKTRLAVIKYLEYVSKMSSFDREEILEILKNQERVDTDKEILVEIRRIKPEIKIFKKKNHRK